jgi:ribonuclease HII
VPVIPEADVPVAAGADAPIAAAADVPVVPEADVPIAAQAVTAVPAGAVTAVAAETVAPVADQAGAESASTAATPRAKRRRRSSGSRLFRYDRALGARFVAGADEAGRGCLAGPLVAAAVLFDYEALTLSDLRSLSALNDSKQHTAEMREALYPRVLRAATKVAVTSRCVRGIDARGLHKTNLAALSEVLARVGCEGSLCLSDGFPVPPTGFDQRPVVGGDATSAAIAAASVVAKVSRDRFMRRMEERYPGWEFATHVGYSTPEHRAAIERLGVSPLHRMSFQSMAYQQLAL